MAKQILRIKSTGELGVDEGCFFGNGLQPILRRIHILNNYGKLTGQIKQVPSSDLENLFRQL